MTRRSTVSCVFWVMRVLFPLVSIFLSLVQLVQSKSFNTTVDDASEQIHYSDSAAGEGNWFHTNEVDYCYNNTESLVSAVDASASLQFNGTGIYILGSNFESARPFFVTLDGEKSGPFLGTDSENALNLVPIWGVTNLTQDAPHLIVVLTSVPVHPIKNQNYTFSLDGFIVTQELDASTTSAVETSSSLPLPLTTSSSVPGLAAVSPRNENLGTIAGVVAGGMVAAVLAMLVILRCRRRRARKRENESLDMMTEIDLPIGGIIPFILNSYDGDPIQQVLLSSTRSKRSERKAILAPPNGVYYVEARGPTEDSALPLLGAAAQPQGLQEANEPNTERTIATGRSRNGDSFPDFVPPPDYDTLSPAHLTHDDAHRP